MPDQTSIPSVEIMVVDDVEIGVFALLGGGEDPGMPLHLQKHRIRAGTQRIKVTVLRQLARAGIDPYYLLIDLEIGDNIKEVKVAQDTLVADSTRSGHHRPAECLGRDLDG
jgi:ABC-2 type transport system permease protein